MKSEIEAVLPRCPKKPERINTNLFNNLNAILIILLVVTSGIVFTTINDVIPASNDNYKGITPPIEWNQILSIGAGKTHILNSIITSDDHILVFGKYDVYHPTGYTSQAFFSKLTLQGEILWTNFISSEFNNQSDVFVAPGRPGSPGLYETQDGGFLIEWFGYYGDYNIVKTDNLGKIQWQKTLVSHGWECANNFNDLVFTTDEKIILVGGGMGTFDDDMGGEGNFNVFTPIRIIKFDLDGNLLINKTLSLNYLWDLTIQEDLDGGFIIGGFSGPRVLYSSDIIPYNNNYTLLKLNNNLEVVWNYTTQISMGNNAYSFQKIIPLSDGIVYVQNLIDDIVYSILIIKLDYKGNLLFKKEIKNMFQVNMIQNALKVSDNGILLSYLKTNYGNIGLDSSFVNEFLKFNTDDILEWNFSSNLFEGVVWSNYGLEWTPHIQEINTSLFLITGGTNRRTIDWNRTDFPSNGIRALDTIIMLIDANGKLLWNQVFDEAEYETIQNILVLSNGEVVIFGILHESNCERQLREGYYDDWNSDDKIWIAKINFQKGIITHKSSNYLSFGLYYYLLGSIFLLILIIREIKNKKEIRKISISKNLII